MVRLVPENFRDFNNKREVDRDQLMTVLANVTHLLIRANYNSAKMALYRCVLKEREARADSPQSRLHLLIMMCFQCNVFCFIILRAQLMELAVLKIFLLL